MPLNGRCVTVEHAEGVRALVRQTRAAQGLPPGITDPGGLEQLRLLLCHPSSGDLSRDQEGA